MRKGCGRDLVDSDPERRKTKRSKGKKNTKEQKEKRKGTMAVVDCDTFSSIEMKMMTPLFCPRACREGDAPCTYLVTKYEHLSSIMNIPLLRPSRNGLGVCAVCNSRLIKPLSTANNPLRIASTVCGHLFHLSCYRRACEDHVRSSVEDHARDGTQIRPMSCPQCNDIACCAHYLEPNYEMLCVLDKQSVDFFKAMRRAQQQSLTESSCLNDEEDDLNCTVDTVRVEEEDEDQENNGDSANNDNEVRGVFFGVRDNVATEGSDGDSFTTPPPRVPRVPSSPPPLQRPSRFRNFRRQRTYAQMELPVASVVIP